MIFKIVYDKEIHAYDMKENLSIQFLRQKIQEIFKRTPKHFSLFYKDTDGDEVVLESDQDILAMN